MRWHKLKMGFGSRYIPDADYVISIENVDKVYHAWGSVEMSNRKSKEFDNLHDAKEYLIKKYC